MRARTRASRRYKPSHDMTPSITVNKNHVSCTLTSAAVAPPNSHSRCCPVLWFAGSSFKWGKAGGLVLTYARAMPRNRIGHPLQRNAPKPASLAPLPTSREQTGPRIVRNIPRLVTSALELSSATGRASTLVLRPSPGAHLGLTLPTFPMLVVYFTQLLLPTASRFHCTLKIA